MAHRGSWKRATPEELIHAYILAVARDVWNPKLASNSALMKEWRFHLLSATFVFQVISTEEDLFWRTAAIREDQRSRFNAVC